MLPLSVIAPVNTQTNNVKYRYIIIITILLKAFYLSAGASEHLEVLNVGEHALEVLGSDVRLDREPANLDAELGHELVEGQTNLLGLKVSGGLGKIIN